MSPAISDRACKRAVAQFSIGSSEYGRKYTGYIDGYISLFDV